MKLITDGHKASRVLSATADLPGTCYLCHGGDYAVNVVCLSVHMSVILFVCRSLDSASTPVVSPRSSGERLTRTLRGVE